MILMQKTFEELLKADFFDQISGDVILAFNGVMSQETVVGLGEVLRNEMHQYFPLNIVNRVFAVFIEMAQNVLHYSHSKANSNGKLIGKGSTFIFASKEGYTLTTVNIINEKQKQFLESKLAYINTLNEEDIKSNYLKKRKQVAEGDSKGAGLGLIDMVRRTGNPLKYNIVPADEAENYYFFLGCNILID